MIIANKAQGARSRVPTVLSFLLGTLSDGASGHFAIEKKGSEVWKVLQGFKKQFEAFGGVLKKAQDKIQVGGQGH